MNVYLREFLELIEAYNSGDIAPVTHAYWINVNQVSNECSNCHNVHVGIYSDTLYCPYCGALMDEDSI